MRHNGGVTKRREIRSILSEPERILFWSSNIWSFSDGLLGPLFAVFTQRVGGDVLELTWAWALYLSVTGFCMVFVGKLGDRIGHHYLSVLGYALTTLFTFGYLFVDSTLDLFIVQIGLGMALALSNPTWDALYDHYSGDGSHDGFIWGYASAGRYIAQAVAILSGGLLVTYFSFETLFIIMGSISLFATYHQAKILRYARSKW